MTVQALSQKLWDKSLVFHQIFPWRSHVCPLSLPLFQAQYVEFVESVVTSIMSPQIDRQGKSFLVTQGQHFNVVPHASVACFDQIVKFVQNCDVLKLKTLHFPPKLVL